MKTVFFGSSKFVLPIIETLKSNFDLALVVTTEKLPTEAVPRYCSAHKIKYLSVSKLPDPALSSQLSALNSPLAVLAYFGLIIPKEILQLFPKGILNIHPSLLPKYRGPTPVQTAIINGDKEIGVTIIKLDEAVDHGPILAQEKEPILPTDTAVTLHERLFQKGAAIIASMIRIIEAEKAIKETPQDHSRATFTKQLTRQSGYFDIKNPPSMDVLGRMIRAYYPWPGAWTKAKIMNGEVRIKLLPERKIQMEGGKPMKVKDFMNGYPESRKWLEKVFDL